MCLKYCVFGKYVYIYMACWEASSLQIYGIMGILMVGIHIKSMANPDIHKMNKKWCSLQTQFGFYQPNGFWKPQRFPNPIFRGLSSSSSCLGTTKLNETWIASCVSGAA